MAEITELFEALIDPDFPFLRYALIAGVVGSIPLGVVGSYVVVRRISYIAGANAQCVLGGIGAAMYMQEVLDISWCLPIYGAVASALAAAMVIGLVSLYAHQREDTVIGALWVIGMAVGLMFFAGLPVYVDPMSYLFGNILLISPHDLWMVAGLAVLVMAVGVLFYNKLLAVCFDEEFAELRGVRVKFYYLMLLCLTAMTVVLMIRLLGIILVIALLTLPAAVAGNFSRRLWQMMLLAVLFSMTFIAAGLGVSYIHDLPSGPVIVILAGGVYLATAVGSRLRLRV